MFEFLREWMKSTAVKRQETLNAYLDGELLPQDRVVFERLLADDAALQQELADRQLIKSQLQQLPRVAVPRNFILDANQYRKPAKRPLITYYPVLRGATALTAVIFIFTLGWSMIGSGGSYSAAPAQDAAMESMAEMEMEEVAADMNRVPADGLVGAGEAAASAPADVAEAEEEMLPEAPAANEPDSDMADEKEGVGVVKTATPTATATITPTPTATATATPTPIPTPPPSEPTRSTSSPLSNMQIIQIGLFGLFIALLAVTLYVKRQR